MIYRRFLVFVVLCFLVAVNVNAQEKPQNKVVSDFISRLRDQDLSGMLKLFAIDKYLDNFDFKSYAKDIRMIPPVLVGRQLRPVLPSDFSIYRDINKQNRINAAVGQIELLILVLSGSEKFAYTTPVQSNEDVESYVKAIDPRRMADIVLLQIADPLTVEAKPRFRDLEIKTAKRLGADDLTEIITLVKVGGNTFLIPFTLLKYQEEWTIDSFKYDYAEGLIMSKMTEDRFNQIVSEGVH